MSEPTVSSQGVGVAPPVRQRRLVIVACPDPAAPREVPLIRDLDIGREAHGGLVLADRELSRVHARLRVGDQLELHDRGSRNGLFVDGRRVEQAIVRAGSVIRLGRTLAVVADDELAAGVPLVAELPGLRGGSLAMQRVRGEIALAAPRTVPVLVLGETGVGKERIAEALHRQSGRGGPWVAVNCAAIPADLAESELFGRVAGAFTGATRSDGLFVAADGGTIFLDEVGELSLPVQAKLLRVLAGGELRPVGGTAVRTVDVRVIAATHRAIEGSDFRADLLARLAGWVIRVPPLRARRDDVLDLARGLVGDALDVSAAEALLLYDWPGNVRELEQALQRARILAGDGGTIALAHLPDPVRAALPPRPPRGADPLAALRAIDRSRPPTAEALREVLAHHRGNVTSVARFFGKDRRQVYRWMARHGVAADDDHAADDAGGDDGGGSPGTAGGDGAEVP